MLVLMPMIARIFYERDGDWHGEYGDKRSPSLHKRLLAMEKLM